MNSRQQIAHTIAQKALKEGLRVWLSKSGEYGIYTDDKGERVVGFSAPLNIVQFHGNYHSKRDGTGWEIAKYDIPDRLSDYLNAYPWQGIVFDRFETLAHHLKTYGPSSGYIEQKLEEEATNEN